MSTKLEIANKRYRELDHLLNNLSTKLSEVSKNVDKEFLSSYRVHMLSIQSEIKNLRLDVEKGVQALKSDTAIAKLEEEVNWFVDECTRLRVHFTTMDSDCKQMQARYRAMTEQKMFLNEQLKTVMKMNGVLKREIDYAKRSKGRWKLKTTVRRRPMVQIIEDPDQEMGEIVHVHDDDSAAGAAASSPSHQDISPSFQQNCLPTAADDSNSTNPSKDIIALTCSSQGHETVDEGTQPSQSRSIRRQRKIAADASRDSPSPSRRRSQSPKDKSADESRKLLPRPPRRRHRKNAAESTESPSPSRNRTRRRHRQRPDESGDTRSLSPSRDISEKRHRKRERKVKAPHETVADDSSKPTPSSGIRDPTKKTVTFTLSPSPPRRRHRRRHRKRDDDTSSPSRRRSPSSHEQNITAESTVLPLSANMQLSPSPHEKRAAASGKTPPLHQRRSPSPHDKASSKSPPPHQRRSPSPHDKGAAASSKSPPSRGSGSGLLKEGTSAEPSQDTEEVALEKKTQHLLWRRAQEYRNKEQLLLMLEEKSRVELLLERSIAETFKEVVERKITAAKRGSIKRYPVSMTGAVHPKVDKSDALARSMKAVRSSDLLNDEEASLLGQPLIHASGGLSGLGSKQLSDNDNFACMAKYLLNYDVFKQVVERLGALSLPVDEEDSEADNLQIDALRG